jgi:hypothetical protein
MKAIVSMTLATMKQTQQCKQAVVGFHRRNVNSSPVQLAGETRIDSTHLCVRSVISSCIRELVEVVRVLEF